MEDNENPIEEYQNEEITQEEVNIYLDELRESGIVNMFGAAPYVAQEFGITKDQARKMLTSWMETFGERHPSGVSLDQDAT